VRGRIVEACWNDLGTPARYLEATRDVLAGRVPLARFRGADPFAGTGERAPGVRAAGSARLDPGARLAAPALVLEGAVVEDGAVIGPSAVIGAGARVRAGAVVRDAIVWDGTDVSDRVDGAIAAGQERVR
jgi:mannose-1-phosphate guanylyltransferase